MGWMWRSAALARADGSLLRPGNPLMVSDLAPNLLAPEGRDAPKGAVRGESIPSDVLAG